MRVRSGFWAVALCCAALTATAAPDTSPRPAPRPVADSVPVPSGAVAQVPADPVTEPRPRPRAATAPVPVQAGRAAIDIEQTGLARSLVPVPRPERLRAPAPVQASFLSTRDTERASRRGSVCGVRTIRGEALEPIRGKLPGCGVAAPVRVTEIDGIALSRAAIMDCDTAVALRDWLTDGVRPAVGRTGGGLAGVEVAAHYMCRTRNHKPGAKISEHGKGRAIDISALILQDGARITLSDDWGKGTGGRILRASQAAACGPFGTVLGPESDPYHRDHFHFDTARYRSGPYCR